MSDIVSDKILQKVGTFTANSGPFFFFFAYLK